MKTFLKIAGVLLLYAILIVFCRVQGSFFPWFLFYFFSVVLVYEVLTLVFCLRGVTATRRVSAVRLSSGQSLDIHVTFQHDGWWPLFWVRVSETFPKRWLFHAVDAERWLMPLWNREVELTFRVNGLSRGVYRIGDTEIETGDLFGLVRRKTVIDHSTEIIVYPRVIPVRGWSGRRPEEVGMREPTRLRSEESTNVLGVRSYVPGDRLNRIHWPASAHRGTLLSKEFELHVSSEMMFLPDLARESHRDTPESIFELEMVIAASLAKYCYEMRRRFAMTLHGQELTQFPAGSGEALFLRCMEGLAVAEATGYVPFDQTLLRIANELPRGTRLVVVSPYISKQSAIAVEMCSRRVHVEWFVPLGAKTLSQRDRSSIRMLGAARANVHLISNADQLTNMGRGGANLAAGTR
jgi:uncharacterized protein (DUF58 family)